MRNNPPPVTIVIPMYNAGRHIASVLEAVFNQDYPSPVEVIVVNDGSRDRSLEIVKTFQGRGNLRIINQPNQGAAAATNNGFRQASHGIICSVDSDVVLHRDWLAKAVEALAEDPRAGAVQGYYRTPAGSSFWARMMGYDVEARYDAIRDRYVTQVCTGDTAYRREAVEKAGFFDTSFVYGYDNDMSYRLVKAGYRLIFRKDALCDHYWKEGFIGYSRQQYNSAYGRLQLIRKHSEKVTGDSVSGLRMMLQAPLTMLFFLFLIAGAALSVTGIAELWSLVSWQAALAVFGILMIDRFAFALKVFRKQKDPRAFFLPPVHMLRNLIWCWAVVRWSLRVP